MQVPCFVSDTVVNMLTLNLSNDRNFLPQERDQSGVF